MKINNLQRNIAKNLSASIVLSLALFGIIFFLTQREKKITTEINKINSDIADVKLRTTELEGKIIDTKKYKELWKKIPENQKDDRGIKMDDVNAIMNNLAEKYNITAQTIQVPLPEILKTGIFNRKNINVAHTLATISYQAVNDIRANNFMSELINKLPGYIIINNVIIKKEKKYSSSDLIAISSGSSVGAVSVKITFDWYVFNKTAQIEGAVPAEEGSR